MVALVYICLLRYLWVRLWKVCMSLHTSFRTVYSDELKWQFVLDCTGSRKCTSCRLRLSCQLNMRTTFCKFSTYFDFESNLRLKRSWKSSTIIPDLTMRSDYCLWFAHFFNILKRWTNQDPMLWKNLEIYHAQKMSSKSGLEILLPNASG